MAAERSIACRAFAKINLELRVLGVRTDGYHTLRTTSLSRGRADDLPFAAVPVPFRFLGAGPACPPDARSVGWRAAERLWRAARRRGAPRDGTATIASRRRTRRNSCQVA